MTETRTGQTGLERILKPSKAKGKAMDVIEAEELKKA
jgi:hypothetical protein